MNTFPWWAWLGIPVALAAFLAYVVHRYDYVVGLEQQGVYDEPFFPWMNRTQDLPSVQTKDPSNGWAEVINDIVEDQSFHPGP